MEPRKKVLTKKPRVMKERMVNLSVFSLLAGVVKENGERGVMEEVRAL